MAPRKPQPPIAAFGPAIPAPVGKIDAGIGKAAACMLSYQSMIAADIDSVLSQVKAGVIVSKTIIDAWTVSELDKVKKTYAGCAACIDDWLSRMSWEALQLAGQLVPAPPVGKVDPDIFNCAKIPPCPPGQIWDVSKGVCVPVTLPGGGPWQWKPPEKWCMSLGNGCHQAGETFGGKLVGGNQFVILEGPFFSLADLQTAYKKWHQPTFVAGPLTNIGFGPLPATAYYIVGVLTQLADSATACPDGTSVPPPNGPGNPQPPLPPPPCPAGETWDPIKGACVPVTVASECCPLPGQRVTIHSDNTWSIEGDIADFPGIAALLAGVLKIIERDDPPAEDAEWELDEGPADAGPEETDIIYTPVGTIGGM